MSNERAFPQNSAWRFDNEPTASFAASRIDRAGIWVGPSDPWLRRTDTDTVAEPLLKTQMRRLQLAALRCHGRFRSHDIRLVRTREKLLTQTVGDLKLIGLGKSNRPSAHIRETTTVIRVDAKGSFRRRARSASTKPSKSVSRSQAPFEGKLRYFSAPLRWLARVNPAPVVATTLAKLALECSKARQFLFSILFCQISDSCLLLTSTFPSMR
jgi:hypothetical protein